MAIGCLGCGGSGGARTELEVMTFNVLCSFCNPDYDPWENRLAYFADIFERHDPDLIGLQELTYPEEVDQILALRPGYEAIYFLGEEAGPYGLVDYPDATILYRSARFRQRQSGFFWLSETPDVPWSAGWAEGLQFARIVDWAQLEERETGRLLLFVTTHFDNNSPNQEHSAPLLLERIGPMAGEAPAIVTGDFNSQPADPAYATLTSGEGFRLDDAFDIAARWSVASNRDPPPAYDHADCIDHIFYAGAGMAWQCPQWTVDTFVYGPDAKYPSDHFPVSARLVFESP